MHPVWGANTSPFFPTEPVQNAPFAALFPGGHLHRELPILAQISSSISPGVPPEVPPVFFVTALAGTTGERLLRAIRPPVSGTVEIVAKGRESTPRIPGLRQPHQDRNQALYEGSIESPRINSRGRPSGCRGIWHRPLGPCRIVCGRRSTCGRAAAEPAHTADG
jgi:hypothetical protein